MANPEVEKKPQIPGAETETSLSKEVPEEVERKEGTQAVKKITAPQTIPAGGPPPGATRPKKTPVITLPEDGSTLEKWSKGSPNEAKTWFGKYWLRMILKAIQSGWKIISGRGGEMPKVKN